MGGLRLRVLGDLEVIRGDAVLGLPPSRKTRGLLAYLALNPRSLRREHLCELLWEVPDDPRGSLRWSLSKIRKLVDDAQHPRIIADRSSVAFDATDVDIDVLALHAIAGDRLDDMSTAELEAVAGAYQGCFLEGLELPDFHDFYTWCIGERERATRSQAALLRALVERLESEPARALPHASRLVSLLPYDEAARATLIELLLQVNRRQEAEQQYRMGVEKLREAGAGDSALLYRALRGAPGAGPAAPLARESPIAPAVDRTLVGRERELATLRELVDGLVGGAGARALLIRGEPGMGKSRLLQATAAMAREAGAGLLKASAFESERIRPFAAWNDALRRALPDNPASALLSGGERVSRDQVFASLSDIVAAVSAERPVVVLLDDVQWCDESSASAMRYVLGMNRRRPVLVVAAARDTELGENIPVQQCIRGLRQEGMLQEVRLEPMDSASLRELITMRAPRVDADRLSRESGGNPLLALELARAEQEGGNATSLSELVQERISRLDEDAVDVLRWAAVLAPGITIRSLEQVTSLDHARLDAAIEAAERQGILHPGERGFRFSHDLIARCIYEQLSAVRRQAMHRRVAELLEVDAVLDLALAADLAHHAQKSGDPALAARAMVSAGRLCLRFYANDDALALHELGLDFARQLGDAERVCLTLELCDIRLAAAPLDEWETAVEEYTALAEQALDHGALEHARLGYQMASYLRWVHGRVTDAQRDSLQAERVTRTADDEAHILGMAEAAKCLALLERDLPQADAMAMEARALAVRRNFQCPPLPTALGILEYYQGRLDEAVEHLEDARTLCRAQGDRVGEYLANEYLAVIEVERGDFSAALGRCRKLLEIGSRLREGSEHPFAEAMQALCHYGLSGEDTGLEEILRSLREADAKQRLTFLLNRGAMLDIRHDRLAGAADRASEALQLAQLMERPSEMLQAHISLALIFSQQGAPEQEAHLTAVKELAAGQVARWARERAEAFLTSNS